MDMQYWSLVEIICEKKETAEYWHETSTAMLEISYLQQNPLYSLTYIFIYFNIYTILSNL